MSWLRIDDTEHDSPLTRAVGNAAYGALVRIRGYSCHQRSDGWVPSGKVQELCTPDELYALTLVRIGARGPWLHQPGDDCSCLAGRSFPEEPGYVIHAHLEVRSQGGVLVAERHRVPSVEVHLGGHVAPRLPFELPTVPGGPGQGSDGR